MVAWMAELKTAFLSMLLKLLPYSPFVKYIDALEELPYLNYLNWFIPVGTFITIGTAWLGVITIYYMYSILLRWIKAID